MPDVLIRDLPAEALARLDTAAARLGISRSEYIRRRLTQDAQSGQITVAHADLERLSADLSDLADETVMSEAWS